jgi:hypothetical protein
LFANMLKNRALIALAGGALLLAGCGLEMVQDYPQQQAEDDVPDKFISDGKQPTIFGDEGGYNVFGSNKSGGGSGGGSGLGVNSFLWRATLDTISFMPLSSADPFGGVIITDWFTPPEAPTERFKMNVYIMDRQLRADGIKVAVFRQRINGQGVWMDSTLKAETATSLENQILTRARQLRLASSRYK